jgi:hypothetical protein
MMQTPQPDMFHFQQAPAPMHHQQQNSPMPDWASDFSRLHVSHAPSTPPQMMAQAPQPQASSWMNGWHNEFLQDQTHHMSNMTTQIAPATTFAPSYGSMFGTANADMGMQSSSMFGGFNTFGSGMYEQQQQQQPAAQSLDPFFDDAAFERAFEAASMEVSQQMPLSPVQQQSFFETFEHNHVEQVLPPSEIPSQMDLTAKEEELFVPPETDADELAKTAGRLLDSVKDDQTQKFQESAFLALMRRIRDREVTVEGDKMVETTPSPPAAPLSFNNMDTRPPVSEPWMDDGFDEYSEHNNTLFMDRTI